MSRRKRFNSLSQGPNYNLDDGDSEFEDSLEPSQKSSTNGKLKRKRESRSPRHRGDRAVANRSAKPEYYLRNHGRNYQAIAEPSYAERNHLVKLKVPRSIASETQDNDHASDPDHGQDEQRPKRSRVMERQESEVPNDSEHLGDTREGFETCDPINEARKSPAVISSKDRNPIPTDPRRSSRRANTDPKSDATDDASGMTVPATSRRGRVNLPVKKGSEEDDYVATSGDADDTLPSDGSFTSEADNMDNFIEEDDAPYKAQRRVKSRRKVGRVVESEDEACATSNAEDIQAEVDDLHSPKGEERRRALRDRTNRPDYAVPPPLPEQMFSDSASRKRNTPLRSFRSLYPEYGSLGLGYAASSRQTFGDFGPPKGIASDSSLDSSDDDGQTNRSGGRLLGSVAARNRTQSDRAQDTGFKDFGRVKGANMADADPIAVDKSIDFQSIGGLKDHINQLKEMVSLPLLYPEVFQRFHISPPRGVLFHGPPGTGKTLMARALAASCSSESTKISFYMRKGADCLSKWVGEAERQLRLLFEEAKNNQPSIIFFDEIDGLAPVRSAKQDQIHASIVSTLLALMDGMDSRGQVVIIGATNRPDSIDPALRRPGRFDREFYFPLPELDSRRDIIAIHTRKWDPPLSDEFTSALAEQTKGYGGADLRALCTEAALYAVQRRYPQIYQSAKKLVIDPTTISVTPRDFTLAISKIVPSSARSTASSAMALPVHLVPLLSEPLTRTLRAIDNMLPRSKKQTALEESTHVIEDTTFEKENLKQLLDNLRIHRPRLLISGHEGSGQEHIGRAILQHLEGIHVRTLDLAAIFGDPNSTAEASLIQAFTEARRHPPSALYMPSVELWFSVASESLQFTLKSLLSAIGTNERVAVIGTANRTLADLPPPVKELFGQTATSYLALEKPSPDRRYTFFNFLVSLISMSPAQMPDTQTQRRVLETLPVAPAPAPREISKAEKKAMDVKDKKTKLVLKAKLGPLMELLRTRYKRFKKPAIDEKDIQHLLVEDGAAASSICGESNYEKAEDGMILDKSTSKKFYNMDLNLVEERLWRNLYLTPKQFQNDIEQIVHDAQQEDFDRERVVKAQELLTNVLIHLEDMFDSQFLEECKRMAMREVKRHQSFLESRNNNGSSERAPCLANRGATHHENNLILQVPSNRGDKVIEDNAIDTAAVEALVSEITKGCTNAAVDEPVLSTERAESLIYTNGTHAARGSSSCETMYHTDVLPIEKTSASSAMPRREVLPTDKEFNKMSLQAVMASSTKTPSQAVESGIVTSQNNSDLKQTEVDIDPVIIDSLHARWVALTNDFNVDQLEEVNSAAIGTVWRVRSDSDRNRVAETVHATIEASVESLLKIVSN